MWRRQHRQMSQTSHRCWSSPLETAAEKRMDLEKVQLFLGWEGHWLGARARASCSGSNPAGSTFLQLGVLDQFTLHTETSVSLSVKWGRANVQPTAGCEGSEIDHW